MFFKSKKGQANKDLLFQSSTVSWIHQKAGQFYHQILH